MTLQKYSIVNGKLKGSLLGVYTEFCRSNLDFIVAIEISNNQLFCCPFVAKTFFNNTYIYSEGFNEREDPNIAYYS